MSTFPTNSSSSPASTAVLAGLVEQVADHLARGRRMEVDAILEQHPEHAQRLRELLPAMGLLANVGQDAPAWTRSRANGDQGASTGGNLLGDFQILREIGSGGMGVVYEAEQLSLSRRVALKVLPFAGMLDSRQLQRFGNEAKAAASLHHQNIVPVYAVGSDRGVHFYAMQLISGRTLAQVIQERRAGTPSDSVAGASQSAQATKPIVGISTIDGSCSAEWYRTIAGWGAQIADALEYAHAVGIVHRDIKPANLMLDYDGKVWVTDFGLAQMEADAGLTMTGGLIGTLRYMSPEQANGERGLVDQRSDVYSLGVTLYELLTLEPAFWASDQKGLLRRVIDEDPRPPRLLNPSVPADLETIILKALQKDPPERYATAGALADDLRRFVADQPITARRPGRFEHSIRWCRRHARSVIVAAVACGLGLISLSVGTVVLVNERNKTAYERRLREQREQVARAGEASIRLNHYVLHFALAAQAWDDSLTTLAKEHLVQCIPAEGEPDVRGVEWQYLWGLVQKLPPPFARHGGPVAHVCFSPDGRLLATGGVDGARIWNYETGDQVAWLREHSPAVTRMKFSPDGAWLVTTGGDHNALLWDTTTWKIQRTFRMPQVVIGAEFTPDGKLLAVAEMAQEREIEPGGLPCRLSFFATSTWQQEAVVDNLPAIRGGAFSPNSVTLALISHDRLRFLDIATRREADQVLTGAFSDVAYSPNQPLVVSASGESVRIDHLPLSVRKSSDQLLGHRDLVESVSFTPDGRLVSASRDRTVVLWEFIRNRPDRPMPTLILRHDAVVWEARAAPDGQSLATGCEDGTVRRWDLRNIAASRRLLDVTRIPYSLRFVPGGNELLVGEESQNGRREICIRALPSGDELARQPNSEPALVPTAACNSFRSERDGPQQRIVDAVTGKLKFEARGFGDPVFSPTCSLVAFGPHSRVIRICNCHDWSVSLEFAATPGKITTLSWSPDGRTLAVGSDRGTVKLYNVGTGRELMTLVDDMQYVHAVAFSPNGRFLVAGGRAPGDTGDLRIWDFGAGDKDPPPGIPRADRNLNGTRANH